MSKIGWTTGDVRAELNRMAEPAKRACAVIAQVVAELEAFGKELECDGDRGLARREAAKAVKYLQGLAGRASKRDILVAAAKEPTVTETAAVTETAMTEPPKTETVKKRGRPKKA